MEILFFLLVAAVAVIAAVGVIALRNTVHCALLMVVNLFCVAMLYLSLSAEFLAVVQVTVYAGAIMVLFLFVIAMLNPAKEEGANRLRSRLPLAVGCALVFLVAASYVFASQTVATPAGVGGMQAAVGDPQTVGGVLFTQYLLPFELTSLLLLVAMVAAMVLGRRRT